MTRSSSSSSTSSPSVAFRNKLASIVVFFRQLPRSLLAVALGSAVLMVLSFPSYSIWWFSFFGFAPFLYATVRARSVAQAVAVATVFMMAFVIIGFPWIAFVATNFGGLPWIVGKFVLFCYSIFGESQFLILGLVIFFVARRVKASALWPLVWCWGFPLFFTGLDWAYPKIFPSSFGNVLYSWFPVAQAAEYIGVFGLALPIVLLNFNLLALVDHYLLARRYPKLAPKLGVPPTLACATLAMVVAFFSVTHFWGVRRIAQIHAIESDYTRTFKYSVVQANIGDLDKLASERGYYPAIEKVLSTYEKASLETAARFKPDLVVWPETAYPFLYSHQRDPSPRCKRQACDQWVMDLADKMGTALFFGTYSQLKDSQGLMKDYNSAYLVGPRDTLYGVYRKYILLAFGEYVPLGPLSQPILNLLPMIANFGRGPGPTVIDLNGVKIAPQICYEGLVPDHVRAGVLQGADIQLNVTNDSWFGDGTEPWLHLLLTAFRTIEVRRPMLRATNAGITTLIDSTGEMQRPTKLFETVTYEGEVRLPSPSESLRITTFFAKYGDLFSKICGVLGVLCLAAGVFFSRRRIG